MRSAEDFEALFRRHHDAVLRYAVRRVGAERADDVVSEVFVVAWRRRDDEPVDRLPWLLAVARRVIANSRRSDERVDALWLRIAGQPPPAQPDHGDIVAVRDTWSRALAALSHDDQELLALVAWDQLSPSQAAAVLGCSTATFLVRLSRARRRLRSHLTSATSTSAAWKETKSCHTPVEPT